jgi:DME family drug/metabolite transporter
VSWSATLSLAEPLTASLLGLAVLGESLAPVQLAGAALVAIGLLVLASSRAPS